MQFGKVNNPEDIDFSIPSDHPDTTSVLNSSKGKDFNAFIGCAKWNKQDLKGFYPRGTKDELAYYATQFNCIELNATFYKSPSKEQVKIWYDKTPPHFKFFPKLPNTISHFKRLVNAKQPTEEFCDAIAHFEEKLGMTFLQLHDNFKPKDFESLKKYLNEFPKVIPLAVEVRNSEWFSDKKYADEYYELIKSHKITNILVDTAGRRDMMHMRLSTDTAFVRWVGANHPSDYKRLDEWIGRITKWKNEGLKNLYFFIHQNVELESPLLSAYFIEKLNKSLKLDLQIPKTLNSNGTQTSKNETI
ncbi:protein of unknown function DUF72 [Pseudopedobacter saltans DSM 12145]|uniref:DUF72 domain-containing protein n=1 Tax=Pseudopedobacter saltans (strain ATCC 51119 / DSM 12145 / JCM 21818 / CCUG 39354 / LMG 10337 / NBRC 100064 / NCIMB 13643) TaxID=762903 RepID=F0SB12_PSESL|nr:DUF72 domain-containing protein [Pseudopedobacter saltans]ADY52647.1 protein of unknown function DUF72 [Pseudopedobacter saltans DSM 12145]